MDPMSNLMVTDNTHKNQQHITDTNAELMI